MAVRIPIEADAQHVLGVFNQIREAIRATGQEGQSFQNLDFSHPELSGLASDIQKVQQQFDDLARVGRGGTAAAVRSIRETNPNASALDWLAETDRYFPDEGDRLRHQANVGGYVLRGTQFERQSPAAAPPPRPPRPLGYGRERMGGISDDGYGDPEDDDSGDGGGGGGGGRGGGKLPQGGAFEKMFSGSIKNIAKFSLGAAGATGVVEGVIGQYESAQREAVLNDQLYRRIGDTGTSFEDLRKNVVSLANSINVTTNEAQGLSASWARLTNQTSSSDVISGTRYAADFARGFGTSTAGAVNEMGRATALGVDQRDFAVLIAEAVREGGRNGSEEETAGALLRWTETATRTLLDHNNVGSYAAAYAALNATGLPGLRGEGAERLLGQVNSSIQGGGSAGVSGQALLMRALARYGVTDPYQVQFQLQGGAFEQIGKNGPTNFQAALSELEREYPGNGRGALYRRESALGSLFGISMRDAGALMNAGSPADIMSLQRAASAAGVDIRNAPASALAEMSQATTRGANLSQIAGNLLGRKDLDPTDVERLHRAQQDGSQGALQTAILQTLAARGGTNTVGNQVAQANSNFSNNLQEVAHSLVEPLTGLKDNIAQLLPPIASLADVMSASFVRSTGIDDVSLSKNAAAVMQRAPGTLADMVAAMNGDPEARKRLQVDVAHINEGADAFMPFGGRSGSGELAPDVADDLVAKARAMGLSPSQALALARTEGGGYDRRSPAGAWGPMQLEPDTAAAMGVHDIHDWRQNDAGGLSYFKQLLARYGGNAQAAVAAYNAGPNNAGVIRFAATGDRSGLPAETLRELSSFDAYQPDYEKRLGGSTPMQHQVHGSIEVTVRQPDGSLERKTTPLTHVHLPVPSGTRASSAVNATPAPYAVPAGQHGY